MTLPDFVLGAAPTVWATGAGAEMRQVLGIAVFDGMIGVTYFDLDLTCYTGLLKPAFTHPHWVFAPV